MNMISEIMTLQEAAQYLKVNKKTLYRMVKEGQIPCFKVRSEWRFKKDVIDRWIEEQGASERGRPDYLEIPVLGQVAAGRPILAEENIEGTVRVSRDKLRNPAGVFALRVQGESMINANINDGDIVLVRDQPDVDNGEIAAVVIDNEATLKRVFKKDGQIILKPENNTMEPTVVDPESKDIRIAGKMLMVLSQSQKRPAATANLTKDEIFRQLRAHQDVLDKHKVKRIGLFGSYARGEQTSKSDIDFLIEFEEPDFDNFMNLNYFLEDLFRRKVELITPVGLSPYIKPYVEKEVIWYEG